MLTRDLSKLSIPVVPRTTPLQTRIPITHISPLWFARRVNQRAVSPTRTVKPIRTELVTSYVASRCFGAQSSPMTLTPFETNLYQHLTPFFAARQFTLLPDRKQFRRSTSQGFQNVILSPAFYGEETWLEVNFGCRNEQVEQIAQQFLNNLTDYRPDANTLIVSIGKFNGLQYFRYKIHSDEELIDTCGQIEQFFDEHGFAFLADSCALSTLDRLLNEHPGLPSLYVYNQTHRCYKGLVTARLNHNPHFDGLIDNYRQLLIRQTQNPYEQLHFERLIAYLQHYSAN